MSTSSLQRLSDLVPYLVDPKVGVIEYVQELPPHPGAPDFFHFFSNACDTRAFVEFQNFNNAGGAAIDREVALAKAIGEAVERYCAAVYEADDLPLRTFDEAEFSCIEPEAWALFSEAQYEQPGFPWAPFTRDTPVRWTAALDPLSGAEIWVPACMVYMPYYFHLVTGDTPIVQPISTGMAAHCSPAEAAVSGFCEVIERDALMLTWQAMVAPPQIAIDSLSDENYDLVSRFEVTGGRVTLLNMTVDIGVPTVLAVMKSEAEELPAMVFAASCSPDPEEAVRKALEELAHTRRYCHAIKTWMPRLTPNPPSHDNVTDQITHLNFWTDQANAHLADFLFESDERIDFDDIESAATGSHKGDVEMICERARALGHQAVIIDMTTREIRDLGMTVLRALIPGFHPLLMSYANRSLGGTRLYNVPQLMGHPGIGPNGRDLPSVDNPSPHMYP